MPGGHIPSLKTWFLHKSQKINLCSVSKAGEWMSRFPSKSMLVGVGSEKCDWSENRRRRRWRGAMIWPWLCAVRWGWAIRTAAGSQTVWGHRGSLQSAPCSWDDCCPELPGSGYGPENKHTETEEKKNKNTKVVRSSSFALTSFTVRTFARPPRSVLFWKQTAPLSDFLCRLLRSKRWEAHRNATAAETPLTHKHATPFCLYSSVLSLTIVFSFETPKQSSTLCQRMDEDTHFILLIERPHH